MEKQKWEESEKKVRSKKIRKKKVRRKKMQVREKVDKSRSILFFHCFVAPVLEK